MKVRVTVVSVDGKCAAGYREGDCFHIDKFLIKSEIPICIHAISSLQNFIYALSHGLKPEEIGMDEIYVACPDPGKPFGVGKVIFKLEVVS